ncbi:uncharacterized protein BO80DRAFT_291761 [Aspergillus ibericus CBS 121593]|uniref:Uncharacterized protein n=1 Tax=Aspergillus ibericus CBS 121593 TaxID=1448316 RepID=A0A395GHQ1_9EURO|nr:hypothetical protein BO80DRAFT_291761 [Aspergillus ibericus CBS 121593]RAK94939.1 hypothetical protein BO80DRAFT_291761 [Aspergillus ibericus CBS 121593]
MNEPYTSLRRGQQELRAPPGLVPHTPYPSKPAVQIAYIVSDGPRASLRELSGGALDPCRRLSNASRAVSVHFRAGRTRRSVPAGIPPHTILSPFSSMFLVFAWSSPVRASQPPGPRLGG